jgi:hypothetical protein
VYGLAVSSSGYGCECMGWLYLSQDSSLRIWAGGIKFRNGGCGYRLPVCRSKYDCECMGWLYLGKDMSVSVWVGCI